MIAAGCWCNDFNWDRFKKHLFVSLNLWCSTVNFCWCFSVKSSVISWDDSSPEEPAIMISRLPFYEMTWFTRLSLWNNLNSSLFCEYLSGFFYSTWPVPVVTRDALENVQRDQTDLSNDVFTAVITKCFMAIMLLVGRRIQLQSTNWNRSHVRRLACLSPDCLIRSPSFRCFFKLYLFFSTARVNATAVRNQQFCV